MTSPAGFAHSARTSDRGRITRGTTAPNRLRRLDRWLVVTAGPQLRQVDNPPVVIDLGFGATPVTTLEMARRLASIRPDVRVIGMDIDAGRVAAARSGANEFGVEFEHGGFEIGGRLGVHVLRAANVLRQYGEDEVAGAWARWQAALAPGGMAVDATTDELGRLGSWIVLRPAGPHSLVISARLEFWQRPSDVAARLPKALIHHNCAGQGINRWLDALDASWAAAAPWSSYGPRSRWMQTARKVKADGWPVLDGPRRWRLGEIAVAWSAVAP